MYIVQRALTRIDARVHSVGLLLPGIIKAEIALIDNAKEATVRLTCEASCEASSPFSLYIKFDYMYIIVTCFQLYTCRRQIFTLGLLCQRRASLKLHLLPTDRTKCFAYSYSYLSIN